MQNKFLLFLVLCVMGTMPARAEQLTYAVYAGGFQVLDMKVDLMATSKTYATKFDLGLHGWLAKLAPWWGRIETTGVTPANPRKHQFVSSWKGDVETTLFTFGSKGFVSGKRTGKDSVVTKIEPDKELTSGAVDVVTTLYMAMRALDKVGSCALTQKVFDGRRSFTITYKDVGTKTFKKSQYNAFAGEVRQCTVEIKPLAGKWHEKPRGWLSVQEQSKLKGKSPTLSFGQILAGGGYAPVRADLQTRYEGAVLNLVNVTK